MQSNGLVESLIESQYGCANAYSVNHPIITQLDFGIPPAEVGIWFGILVLMSAEVGLITPPVGLNLFVINAMSDNVGIGETYRGALPFVVSDIIRIAILVAFPAITLGLVRLLF